MIIGVVAFFVWIFASWFTLRGMLDYLGSVEACRSIDLSSCKPPPHGHAWRAFSHIQIGRDNLVLVIRSVTIAPFRFILFIVLALISTVLVAVSPTRLCGRIMSFMCAVMLMILGLRVQFSGSHDPRCHLVVSNHVGMFDILVLLVLEPVTFLADNAIRRFYFVGWAWGYIAEKIGCVFVSRENEESRANAKTKLREFLSGSPTLPLVLFPEGTTSNGTGILPFKLGAFENMCSVQPVVLEYQDKRWGYCSVWSDVYFAYTMALATSTVTVKWLPVHVSCEGESFNDFCARVRNSMLNSSPQLADYAEHQNASRCHNHVCAIFEAKRRRLNIVQC